MKNMGQMPANGDGHLDKMDNRHLLNILEHTLNCFDSYQATTAREALAVLKRRDKNSEVCSHGAARVATECKLRAAGSWPD